MVASRAHIYDMQLFASLAEDLKAPLTRIAYRAEVAGLAHAQADDIQQSARHAMQLLDAYLLSHRHTSNQTALQLEPVHPSSVIVDAAYELKDFAKKFSCQVHVETTHIHTFALSHRLSLVNALISIGKVFIEGQSVLSGDEKNITLASYKTKQGIAVGIFQSTPTVALQQQLLSRARSHIGQAARPFVGLASGASAQLFVAERLLHSVQSNLRSARRGQLSGLAFDLVPSAQLTLV